MLQSSSLYKSQRMKSTEAMISDYSVIKLEINNKKITHIFGNSETHFLVH